VLRVGAIKIFPIRRGFQIGTITGAFEILGKCGDGLFLHQGTFFRMVIKEFD